MKILFVLHLPPPVHGAAAVGLQIKESPIINETFDCTYINLGTSVTVEEIGINKRVKLSRYLVIFGKVLWNIIFNRPDICYFSMTAKCIPFYKDASLALLARLFRLKIIYHFHNKGVSSMQDHFWDNFLYRLLFRNSDVILLSKQLYPDIQKYVSQKHVYYCPNGIPDADLKLSRNGDGNHVVDLLFLSNLMESKGLFVLLEACKLLKKREVSFHCTIAGGTGDICGKQLQMKLQEMDLTDKVNYVGKKFKKEKEDIFTKSDIFVHPTLNDCFPLVLLEAMQFSLPVISTVEGGIPDIVEEGITGFLVHQNEVEALADKIETLINNPVLRQEMGKAGRKKYENEFTLSKFEHRLEEILRQTINK